ncbi:MAG: hypothetical protein QM756_21075 [Polyangiaceae bacterium]
MKNNRVAIRNVTDVGFSYSFSEKFWAGLDLWTAFNILEPQTYDSPATPPPFYQFVAEPKLGLRLGKVRPSLGFIAPLGGRLADSGIYGAHLRLDIVL